jgi:endogenous inhibitor of DNA gyrase (YacG/DUF329 family)
MTQPVDRTGTSVKYVRCPTCGGDSVYAPNNPFRPFCCERCKQIDLGAWASEQFTVAADTQADDDLTDQKSL